MPVGSLSSRPPHVVSSIHPRKLLREQDEMPPPKRLRRCQGCDQFAVYCGKYGEEWVWRCKYCGMAIPLTDEELELFGLRTN